MGKIQIKRGLQENVANLSLAPGEPAIALDTGNLYIGTTAGNTHVNPTGGTADAAAKLTTARNFTISGDGTAEPVSFDGTAPVDLKLVLAASGVVAGTYPKVVVDAKGRVTSGYSLNASDIPNITKSKITDFPTAVSSFTNDSGYQTAAQVEASIAALVGSAPDLLNTLEELSNALGDDPNFATTMTNALANKENILSTATAKASVVDADTFGISDSAASNATKKISYSNLKAALKTYFDTLYNNYTYTLPTASASTKGGVKVGAGLTITNEVLAVGDIDGGTF